MTVFDKDGNGTIDLEELRTALTQIGETMTDTEVEELFEAADSNHDGSLDYNEFVELMCGGSIFDSIWRLGIEVQTWVFYCFFLHDRIYAVT